MDHMVPVYYTVLVPAQPARVSNAHEHAITSTVHVHVYTYMYMYRHVGGKMQPCARYKGRCSHLHMVWDYIGSQHSSNSSY